MKTIKKNITKIILERGTIGGTTPVSRDEYILLTNQDEMILTNQDELVYSE